MTERESYWGVCRLLSNRLHRVRDEIEKTSHGTFVPTYARVWTEGGKPCAKEVPLIPGYLFFRTNGMDWAGMPDIPGVIEVLSHERIAIRVSDREMNRMVLNHAMRTHDDLNLDGLERAQTRRRRRPRPGKRLRNAMKAVAA